MNDKTQQKPALSLLQIWNMSFGFIGIQVGFGLQNANASRIFETLGANVNELALYWLAGPVTGLLIQPLIGYMSDRTWTRFGRRRPFFLIGALLGSFTLIVMPNSPALWVAVSCLWILDSSLNISMEPFRAFVADMLPSKQRPSGYAMQGVAIGIGAGLASGLPWFLTLLGVSNVTQSGIPNNVQYAFYIGAAVFILAVLWTIIKTPEYTPAQLSAYEAADTSQTARLRQAPRESIPQIGNYLKYALISLVLGGVLSALIAAYQLEKELYVFSVAIIFYGVLCLFNAFLLARQNRDNMLTEILDDLMHMPLLMRRIAIVQFFSFFGFFIMWIYTTSAVTSYHFGSTDTQSVAYNNGADLVGVLFLTYNVIATIYAFILPWICKYIGVRLTHSLNLVAGGLAMIGFYVFTNSDYLFISMIGIGMAWASILTLPYVVLSDNVPYEKMGIYMGIFNFFIVIPQIIVASIIGSILIHFLDGQAIYTLLIAGIVLFIGAFSMRLFVPYDNKDIVL